MPPILPSKSEFRDCVKIVRLEGGLLQELAEGLVRLLSGRQVGPGSVVLLTSATNMATAGFIGYTEDLLAAIKFLRRSLGDHILYGPLPNMLMTSCGDEGVIRVCIEVSRWAMVAFKDDRVLLHNSFHKVEEQFKERNLGDIQVDTKWLPLPNGGTVTVSSGGWQLPTKLSLLTKPQEEAAVKCMLEEIRDQLAIDLDLQPDFNRWPDVPLAGTERGSCKTFLLVGSSHAGKLGAALRQAGHNADVIYEANWRAVKNNIDFLAEKTREKLGATRVDAVIYCVLDNSIYYALTEAGDTGRQSATLKGDSKWRAT
jgi:hypothetical protein